MAHVANHAIVQNCMEKALLRIMISLLKIDPLTNNKHLFQ